MAHASQPVEWRWDVLHNRWVIFTPVRRDRPGAAWPRATLPTTQACAFCPSHEADTPPASYEEAGIETPWKVRVVPNKYSFLGENHQLKLFPLGAQRLAAVGISEVVIETPVHQQSLADYDDEHVAAVWRAYQQRYRSHHARQGVAAVLIFKNHGVEAGASLTHAHSQIVALPFHPPSLLQTGPETDCLICKTIAMEREGPLQVLHKDGWFVWAAAAGAHPFETYLTPDAHGVHLYDLDPSSLATLACLTRNIARAMRESLGDVPYNLVVHATPHMLIEWLPRLTHPAGFEWATGCYVNPVLPEAAARTLREALAQTPS